MNKKRLIILYIIIIVAISVSLLGITYGYVRANIVGNSEAKGFVATSQILKINYTDNTSSISNNDSFTPGNKLTKIFTLKNESSRKVTYSLIIDNLSHEFIRYYDITYKLYQDDILISSGIMPQKNESQWILHPSLELEKDATETYTLNIYYNNSHENQIVDQNKIIKGNINVLEGVINEFTSNTNSLAFNILNDSLNGENGTTYTLTPPTIPSKTLNAATESILSLNNDDYGHSYYYRGNVDNNYVNFNGMCWRIVRIQGDGSIKLILEDKASECNASTYTGNWNVGTSNYGYTKQYVTNTSGQTTSNYRYIINYNGAHTEQTNSDTSLKNVLNTWLESSGIDKSKIKQENWCIGNTTTPYNTSGSILGTKINDLMYTDGSLFYYDVGTRIYITKTPSLRCLNGETDSSYIGTLTGDEVAFAGAIIYTKNTNGYYLINNKSEWWWTLSPLYYQNISTGASNGKTDSFVLISSSERSLTNYFVSQTEGASRPSIVLNANTEIGGGNGTKTTPYIIN